MPDPGDTAQGDYGQGTGWSKTTPTTGNSGGSVGFSGGTLNGGNNYSGNNWGSSTNTTTTTGNTNYGGSNNSGSSYGFSGGTLNGGNNYSGNNWGATNSSSNNYSSINANGGIAGALNAGLGSSYSNPITESSNASTGYYHSFTNTLSGMNNPNKFDTGIYRSNMVNVYGNPMDTWSNGYDPNKLTPGAQKIHQAILDNALRLGTPVDYFSGKTGRAAGTGQHPRGQAIDIRINDPVTGLPVGYNQIGNLAYNPIGNVRLGYRTPAQAKRIQAALEQPYQNFATGVIGSFYEKPDVYGPFDNQRWGGAFETGRFSKDYMHFDEGRAATGVSPAQQALRDAAQSGAVSQVASSTTTPQRLTQAGLGGGLFDMVFGSNAVEPAHPALNDPYSNISEKVNLQQSATAYPESQYSGYGTFNVPYGGPQGIQQTYNVPGGAGVVALNNLTFGPPVQQTATAATNVVPSWQQSTYTGPIQTVMSETPSVPPSQEGEPIPYPVDENSMGYKLWRGMTYVGDQLLPGGGMMLRTMDDNLKERWPGMTNAERQALIDKWDGNNSYGPTGNSGGNWVSGSGAQVADGGDSPVYSYSTPSVQQTATSAGPEPSSEPINTEWKQAALAYGFTPEQLKDPEIAAYVKQLFEMGWFG